MEAPLADGYAAVPNPPVKDPDHGPLSRLDRRWDCLMFGVVVDGGWGEHVSTVSGVESLQEARSRGRLALESW